MNVREIEELVEQIRPLLAGRDPRIQGATIADLLAMWLAGFDEALREDLLTMHIRTVRKLTLVNAAQLRGDGAP